MGIGNAAPVGAKRGKVVGWSAGAVRRHKRWLYGVVSGELTGVGDAVTLTVRDCPASPDEWRGALEALFQALRDAGMIRWHWVVEWQRRGAPHVHLAVYGPEGGLERPAFVAVSAWLRITQRWRTLPTGQVCVAITGPVGWLKYLSKHAARGVAHYQRQGKPAGWETTGRLWGYGGAWPTAEPVEGLLSTRQFWRVRRMVRGYAIADARSRGDWPAVRYLRGMLACDDRARSSVRGCSEWVPGPLFVAMAVCAGWDGEMAD